MADDGSSRASGGLNGSETDAAGAVLTAGSRPRGYGYGGDPFAGSEGQLIEYVKVLYKRRRTALTVFLLVFGSVAMYTFTATPIYEAKTQLLIEKENANVVSFKEAFEQNQIADDYYQTQYRILQSRALARRTIDALKLWKDPRLARATRSPAALQRTIDATFAAMAGWFGRDRPEAGPNETREQSLVIDEFLDSLTVAPIRTSRLVDVRFRSPDPVLAAGVANSLAKAYMAQNLEFRFVSSKEASDWLAERLDEQRQRVEASEQALQRYREQTDAVALADKQNIVVQKLADLNAAVTRAKTDRIQKEAAYDQINAAEGDPAAIDTLPAIVSNTFIQQQKAEAADLLRQQAQLSEKLGPKHPEMLKIATAIEQADARLQAEIAKVLQAVKNDYRASVAQENTLTAALEQQKRNALALNRKGIDYGVLERDAATNRQLFDSLLQRAKETGIATELKTSNIRVVDPAEPPRKPASPNTTLNLALALFGGITLGIAVAFLFEHVDDRIKTPDEIKLRLGLPFLGIVPALFDQVANPLMNDGVPATFAEAFRAIRTNVLFSSAGDGARTFVVTSSGPGEGKTLVSANLAMALAQAGQRVIVVDCDMRKPRLHQVFQQVQEPGLSNVLVGNAKTSETVRPTDSPGLWVMPAGVIPPNPAELLGAKRFTEFIAALQQHFDWLILDTPPVMAVTDSSIAAHVANGVLFVIGSEMTNCQAAVRSIEQLGNARAKLIGAVLNRVDLEHHAYYYSHYYVREYDDYYSADRRSS